MIPGSTGTDFSVIIVVIIVRRYSERVESKNTLRDHMITTLSPSHESHVSPSSANMGEHSPHKSTIPTVFVSKSIETSVVVEDTDMCSIRHDVLRLLRRWWQGDQELRRG